MRWRAFTGHSAIGCRDFARWKDPRGGWIHTQADDWSSQDGTCYAAGSGSPHTISDPGTVNDGYARPRRIDAFFTWPIDMEDWYEASFDFK